LLRILVGVEQFEAYRTHLQAVAYRMLGSLSEADDAVQEAWLRLNRSDMCGVENLGGWLTTVVGRICLDMLRSRKSRREEPIETYAEVESSMSEEQVKDPEYEAILSESVGLALMVVLDTLNPDERLAFVLHDIFAVSFEEIAPIVGRSTTTARQLASRARRRVQKASSDTSNTNYTNNNLAAPDVTRQQEIITAFLAASREGNFEALLTMLDPNIVLRADEATVLMGATREVRGVEIVAKQFSGRAQFAQATLVNGTVGAVWYVDGQPRVVFGFTLIAGKIATIDLLSDPEYLRQVKLEIF
jgi:RNA polymerase sigma-70 factor (ECF subfamily)